MNKLAESESLYLKQHADNPINWNIWSKKALQQSINEDKLIVLSIGYAACHWCHVMEKETFSDNNVAEIMNKHFISIKVDREEQPAVDHVYMDFLLETKGQGGWPLNCILLPGGKPIYAGTYFKKEQWIQLLSRFYVMYNENPKKVEAIVSDVVEQINYREEDETEYEKFVSKDSFSDWLPFLDQVNGGLKHPQKFPMPTVLNFFISLKEKSWKKFIDLTLNRMLHRGLYDQLDGGFFRYCVDQYWHIPHFEKMLYDNAQMLSVLSNFDLFNGERRYEKVVSKSIDSIFSHFFDTFFSSSIDADNVDGEGMYYVFSPKEINSNLSLKQQKQFKEYYLGHENKIWEGSWHLHGDFADNSPSKLAIEKELRLIRNTHDMPAIDNKKICSWNAMMVIALIDSAVAYKNTKWKNKGEKLLSDMIDLFLYESTCYRLVYTNSKVTGCLEDYAWIISAMLKVGSVTNAGYWHELAIRWIDITINLFYDDNKKLFVYSNTKDLYKKKFEVEDQVIPSSNSVMAYNLQVLYGITQNNKYQELALEMFSAVANKAKKWLPNYANWMFVNSKFKASKKKVVLNNVDFLEICDFIHASKGQVNTFCLEKESLITLFNLKYDRTIKNIYVCDEWACLNPVQSIEEAVKLSNENN